MNVITYNVELKPTEATFSYWERLLGLYAQAYNDCATFLAENKVPLSMKVVHSKVYDWLRGKYPELPSQGVIRLYKDVIPAFKSIRSNKHSNADIPQKHGLSLRLDKRLYTRIDTDGIVITSEVARKRVKIPFVLYPKVKELLVTSEPCDPTIFIRDGRMFLSIPFQMPTIATSGDDAVGVDLGIKRLFVTSEGKAFKDKTYLRERRKVRHNKRKLQEKSKNSRSARRHLAKVSKRERNLSRDMLHRATNALLDSTSASVLVVEDLSKIKTKTAKTDEGFKRKRHNNMFSQVPVRAFRDMLAYKAQMHGKRVETVSPTYTSQMDCRTGNRDGLRKGCRYVCADGLVFDADWNAAVNIATRANHPFPNALPLDGTLKFLNGRELSASHTTRFIPCQAHEL